MVEKYLNEIDFTNSEFIESIIHYLDGLASGNEKAALLQWLKQSAQNRKEFDDVRDIWASSMRIYTDDLQTEVALDNFRARVVRYRQTRERKQRLWRHTWRVTAVVFLMVGLAGLLQRKSVQQVAVMNHVVMPQGYKGSVVLPDSTLVWLNADSKLIYPENFLTGNRTVQLTGEAYFDVTENKECPFIVQTDHMEVTVLGTQFSISDDAAYDNVGAILRSGSVSVRLRSSSEKYMLHPDEKISFSKADHNARIERVNADIHTIWASDKLVFDNDRIDDVLERLATWYGIQIEMPRPLPTSDARITLTLRKESKEQAFKVISEIAPVRFNIEENKVTCMEK